MGASAFINKGTEGRETYQDNFKGIVNSNDVSEALKTDRNTELKKRQKKIEDMEDGSDEKKAAQKEWINDYNNNNPDSGTGGMAGFLASGD